MKIIYVHQYFVTPSEGGAVRSYYLARGMVEAAMDVDMITTHNKGYYDLKIIDGIRVHYLPIPYQNEFGFIKRSQSFMQFTKQAKNLIKKLPRPDLFYISSTPLTTGLIGLWAKKKFAVPYIFEVRDLWPDAPIQMGAISNFLLKKLLYQLEGKIYKNAFKIIALSPGIKSNIEAKTDEGKVFLIPNFADVNFFSPHQKNADSSSHKFTISYAGAIGRVNALDEFLDLALQAQKAGKDWQFIMMGKGAALASLKQKAVLMNLENINFRPFGNKQKVKELLQESDMVYISFAHQPVLKTNSPNKFFDALAMGKPMIINHKGWVQELIHNYSLGIFYNTKCPDVSFQALSEYVDNSKKRLEASSRARTLAEKYFSSDIAVKCILHVLDPKKQPFEINDGVYIRTA